MQNAPFIKKAAVLMAISLLLALGLTLSIHRESVFASETVTQDNTPPKELERTPSSLKEKKIDRAGKNIGMGIEWFGNHAARVVGNWINSTTIYQISWLNPSSTKFC